MISENSFSPLSCYSYCLLGFCLFVTRSHNEAMVGLGLANVDQAGFELKSTCFCLLIKDSAGIKDECHHSLVSLEYFYSPEHILYSFVDSHKIKRNSLMFCPAGIVKFASICHSHH